ncbi:hypothetical protein [Sphingomicrobium sediminis]|uniref:Uncharacterized protein n=1 Tax=Sphingomicrobium sediminis TaxID=2950949 RepID=A0A9X2EKB0_9SPHN|nr:hypothetical protein [Sphingomicrobium sediminis]MCM8556922.1 hypothetical protein [Sphingomicrobium sediminis]
MQGGVIIMIITIVFLSVGGWYALEAWKVKHGYPTLDENGNPVLPHDSGKMLELKQENDALRDQLEKVYDRIETLERIVTDKPSRLAEEIDKLAALPPRPNTPEPDLQASVDKEKK